MEKRTKRKLGIAAGLWLAVALAVWLFLLSELRAAHAGWGYEPWDWQYEVSDFLFLFSWSQYVVVSTAFLLAWLCWGRPGHKLGIILLSCGVTWMPVALAGTADLLASPSGPGHVPLSLYAVPLFSLICFIEALVLALVIRSSRKS